MGHKIAVIICRTNQPAGNLPVWGVRLRATVMMVVVLGVVRVMNGMRTVMPGGKGRARENSKQQKRSKNLLHFATLARLELIFCPRRA
ncbi:MAG: hypothetical protein P4K83_00935 [Terracidiphilus sp.]|nr:hypothetical protein [Terracidiphilus sp.]